MHFGSICFSARERSTSGQRFVAAYFLWHEIPPVQVPQKDDKKMGWTNWCHFFQGTYAHFCFWAENSDFGGFCFGGQVLCCFWHLFGAYLGQLGMLGCATPTGAPQILPSAGEKVDKFFGGRSQARVWEDLCRTLPWSDTARRRRYVDFFGALDWELPSNAFSPNWLTLYLPFGKRNITIQRRIKRNPVAKEYTEGDRRIFFETLVVHFGN